MGAVLMVIAVGFLIAVFPVMFAAKIVGAGRHTFGPALLAVILQGMLSIGLHAAALSPLVTMAIAVVVGSAIYAFVLDTSIVRGFFLSIIATIITVVVILGLAAIFAIGGSVA